MILPGTALALFDFDDTLARGDSILPYLLYCVRRGAAPKRQLLRAVCGYLRFLIQPSDASCAKEWTLSFIRGKTVEEMDALALPTAVGKAAAIVREKLKGGDLYAQDGPGAENP